MRRIDTTGLQALRDLEADLYKFGGSGVELRFVGVKGSVRGQFERFGWMLYDVDGVSVTNGAVDGGNFVYKDVSAAILERRERSAVDDDGETKGSVTMTEKVDDV